MGKYLQVFKISFQQEFVYRVNFVMWRIRNVMQILLVFFLWDSVFSDPNRVVFGYDREKILAYVLGLVFVKAFVLSSRSADVAGEVSRGNLSNYLVKPVSYFKYWLVRDVSSKALNLFFAIFEMFILFLFLKPSFYIQTNLVSILGFIISVVLAMLIYFILIFITSSVPFWIPEAAWGVHFLIGVVIVEFLSGALFPLDLLPDAVQAVLNFTPFPYLIFFPLQVYLGNVVGFALFRGLLVCGVWLVLLFYVMSYVWKRGLKVYQAHGR